MKVSFPGIQIVVGDSSEVDLPDMILNLLMFVGICLGTVFLISSLVLQQPVFQWVFSAVMTVSFGFLYWMSRFRRGSRVVAHVATVFAIVLFTINFFIDAGIRGPTLVVVLLVVCIATLLHPLKTGLAYFAFSVVVTGLCILLQVVHPDWVLPYTSKELEIWDISTTFLFCVVAVFFVMQMVMRFFAQILARTKLAQSLALESEQMKMAERIGHTGSWVYNIDSRRIWGSSESLRMFGYGAVAGEWSIEDIESCIPERDRVHQAMVALLAERQQYDVEYEMNPADGSSPRVIHSVARLEKDGQGRARRVLGFVQDITERKQAHQNLAEAKALLNSVVDSTDDLIWSVETETFALLSFNRAYAEHFLKTRGIRVKTGLAPEELLPIEFAKLWREWYLRALREDGLAMEYVTHEGSRALSLTFNLLKRDGKVFAISVFGKDVTERKAAEAKEKDLLSTLKMLSERVPGFMFQYRLGPDGRYSFPFASQAVQELYHISPEDALADASKAFAVCHPEDLSRLLASIEASAKDLSLWKHEFRVKYDDGTVRFLRGEALPQLEKDGGVLWHGFTFDITDLKIADEEKHELEAQLQQSQKMESLGLLAGGIAHDMNNVLGAILGLASVHIETQSHGTSLHKALDTIVKSAERGGKMVKSLLNFARQNPAEEKQLDVNTILREQVNLLERTTLARVLLHLDLEKNLRPMNGDSSALSHAFMNLCVNAVDAMTDNGTLTLHTRNLEEGWIEIVVEDTGTGMPKEVLGRAMDPFFTTKEVGKGTGLGLSMVFSTVKAHRGQMEIESEPGKGTRVKLRFPSSEDDTPPQHAEIGASKPALEHKSTKKTLLVDDDELIRGAIQELLEAIGHEVATAHSGEDALNKLEAGLEPVLVILDMNMPGLGGAGTLPALRSLLPSVPVLLATGRVDQMAETLASKYPGVSILPKPFSLGELQEHLRTLQLE